MTWKIKHASWDSGFTTLFSPRNEKEALKLFEKSKSYKGLITLYSPSGKKVKDFFNK